MGDPRRRFLRIVRWRLRLAWLVATLQVAAPYVAAGLAVVALADWLGPWDGLILLSLGAAVALLLLAVVRALFLPISDWDAARAAERGLLARDALTTALEFPADGAPFNQQIQTRAETIVATRRPREAVGYITYRRPLQQAALLLVLALAIALLPPFGSSEVVAAGIEEALATEAAEVERIADAVEAAEVEEGEEIAAELRALAEELRKATSLEEALEALNKTDRRLEANLDPGFLSQKAAVQGLTRDLTLRPLTDGGAPDAASQFENLADALDQLSDQELAALADRLSDLASSQLAGNPALASDLFDAAAALSAGSLSTAGSALQSAAAGQRSGISEARGQQAVTETLRALEGVRSRVTGPPQGQRPGQGDSQVQGNGEGRGEGQGQGGQGQGQGQGQGGGQGQAGGGASGQIGGVAPGAGGAAGQGGVGSVGGGEKGDFGTGVEVSTVYDPIDPGMVADELQVGIGGGAGQGPLLGRGEAPTQRGESIVPYAEVLPNYLNEAADALTALQVPPSLRGIVQNYFDRLAEQAR